MEGMDLELLVRLVQMQMYSNNYDNRGKRDVGIGGVSDFSQILAAVLDSNRGQPVRQPALGYNIKKPAPINSAVSHLYKKVTAERTGKGVISDIESMVSKAAAKYGLDPGLLRAVIKVESDFNPLAQSGAGAMGLMQLMPGTARALGVKNPFNAMENLEGGASYLRSLVDRFDGDLKLALAAYNAGPGAVEKHGGVPPYKETVSYLQKINSLFSIF
ncbi:MAG: lytic transglycosylase domain-containing protein [Desulfocucumaceae bacterium]